MPKAVPRQSTGTQSLTVSPPRAMKVSKKSEHAVPHVVIPPQPTASPRGPSNSSAHINTSPSPLKSKRKSKLNRIPKHGSNENHPSSLKPSKKRKASDGKAVRPSKWQPFIEPSEEPAYHPYFNCMCDLKTMSADGEELAHAMAKGKVNDIIGPDGNSTSHLLSCEANQAKWCTSYDPATIATDFLRAVGCHPYLPPLNDRFVRSCQMDWR